MTTDTHIPVLRTEMLHFLAPQPEGIYVDATFGGGGYTTAILETANCRVIALDRDIEAKARALSFKERWQSRFDFVQGPFSELTELLASVEISKIDGIVFDLGVSSFQIDQPTRGFSFSKEGPLDMRMSNTGKSAFEILQTIKESELADILYYYGEETKARTVARAIVEHRKTKPLETTTQLASLIEKVIHWKKSPSHHKIHPATRCFQALRIFVNDELRELQNALTASLSHLNPNGRLVVVSFHSLEDRIVKQFMKGAPQEISIGSFQADSFESPFEILTSKPVTASWTETSSNPRSRSAKLRAARKK